jgi:hypothetical protein
LLLQPSLICIVIYVKVDAVFTATGIAKAEVLEILSSLSAEVSVSILQKKKTAGAFYNITLITMAKHPGIG